MTNRLKIVFLLFLCLLLTRYTEGKDLLLHTIQYKLSAQKLFTMATVHLYNDLLPAFMILQPTVEIVDMAKENNRNQPFVSEQQIKHQQNQFQQKIKTISKDNFHKKLQHPIKIFIHNQDQVQQECLFDQPWDLCMIQNLSKRKSIDFSIHCLQEQNQQGKKPRNCNGKLTIRQSDLKNIETDQSKYQQKIKYESGLFALPQSEKHSVMLISCQDDDLPMFSESLKIFSNSRYHRYERENSEEIKELVGFDKSQEITNDLLKKDQKSQQKSRQSLNKKAKKFFYLDVKQQMVRKCLQFQFYSSNKIINDNKVFDYMNLTDSEYKNVYPIVKSQFHSQQQKQESQQKQPHPNNQNTPPHKDSIFKYNMQLTLNIFKPIHILQDESYDIRIKLIDRMKKSTIISYTFPFAISQQSSMRQMTLYSRSNHYHFVYVIGHEIVKDIDSFEVEVGLQAREFNSLDKQPKNTFFFITLSVEDTQNILVEKLSTTYLSAKKDQHLTFLLQEPYSVDQIKTQKASKSTDLIQIIPSSPQIMKINLSQHSSDHQHTTECHFSKGCKFQLDTSGDCLQCKIQYKPSFIKSPNDMLMLQIKQSPFQGKIDLDQLQYFYKELKPHEIVELIINTPNIIIYTLENQQDKSRCKVPKKSCHTQVATSHQKIILSNPNQQQSQLIFVAVEGLDKTRFSLLFLVSDNIVNVANGIPFTYKLPAQKDQIQLLFQVPFYSTAKPYENNITFNLIAPLNSLEMDIMQVKDDGTNIESVQQKSKTMSGFIKLSSQDIKSSKIKITLSKITHYQNHPIHFTLIISTSDHKFRLDTGITHYQIFDPSEEKTFVLQFQDKHTYQLNVHFYDIAKEQVSFVVSIYNPNEILDSNNNKKALVKQKITSKEYVLVLDDQFVDNNELCPQNDPQCTLFVTLSSMMTHQVEISMTLLTTDSVIELKDGVWQTFQLDYLLMRTHFYFIPMHNSNPVKIFFKSSNPQVFMTAILYDNSQNVNPAEWPFPQTHGHSKEQNFKYNQNYMFKSSHLIQLDNQDQEFGKCFPHCVILLSIFQSDQGKRLKTITKQSDQSSSTIERQSNPQQHHTISILASNNQIQLPQKYRLTLQLKQSQQQLIFINLKHFFTQKHQLLTFFTNMIIGYAQIYAKVYVPSLQNIITDEKDYDFLFELVKTQVSLVQIRDIIMREIAWEVDAENVNQLLEKEELYLVLFIVAQEPTKLTVQYTTGYDEITEIQIDSVETISLQANQQKILQFYPTRDQKIKFIRTKGYPLFHQFKCSAQQGGYNNCLKLWLQKLRLRTQDDIRNINQQRQIQKQLSQSPLLTSNTITQISSLSQQQLFPQYQILKKTQTQHVLQCQKCIIFIWIYAMQSSQLTIQLQSLNTQTLIKQNQLVTDYLEPSQYHRYYLPRVQKQFTTILVTVNNDDGRPIVTVSDNLNLNVTKKASQVSGDNGRKVIMFSIPPVKQLQEQKTNPHRQGNTIRSSQFNNIFSNLHISITPQNSKPVSYTLTYSSGQHQTFLKNGLITSQFLFQNENVTFYYKNQNNHKQKSYLTLTVQAEKLDQMEGILDGIQIKMFQLEMDRQKGTIMKNQIASEQPSDYNRNFRKHTTLTYQIPPFDDLQIDIFSKKTTKITIGLMSDKIIFLPLNYQYPVYLQLGEQVRFVLQNLQPNQQIQFVVKKCDQSNPFIFYTIDEKQFQKNLYSNYDKFGSQRVFRHVVKTHNNNPTPTIYIKLKADPTQSSTLIIQANRVYDGQQNFVDLDPGNMGLISYRFENLNEIKINFEGLACGKECGDVVEYYLVRGKSLEKIYNELVCAGEDIVKVFERRKRKQHVEKDQLKGSPKQQKSGSQQQSLVSSLTHDILLQKIPLPLPLPLPSPSQHQHQQSPSRTISLTIPLTPTHPILTIKAIYKPTNQQTYYKPITIKSIESTINSYSSRILVIFAGGILVGLIGLLWATRKLARRGYVHVGEEETMVV